MIEDGDHTFMTKHGERGGYQEVCLECGITRDAFNRDRVTCADRQEFNAYQEDKARAND